MRISVVAASREDDRPPTEAMSVATLADQLGYPEVWLGEGPTWDAFVLATAVGDATDQITLTAGPVPVAVRDPATNARGAASVQALTGNPVGVALGTSSVRVVEEVHGRSRARPASVLEESARTLRPLIGPTADPHLRLGPAFPRRLPPATGPLTVAAFGNRAIRTAARYADRMLLDLVSPAQVRTLRATLDAATAEIGRPRLPLAAWLPTAVDPDPASYEQLMRSLVGYLTVRGYSDMFTAAGFGDAVALAASGADPEQLLAALPREAASAVGLVGDLDTIRRRLTEYADAGLDEVAIVPATSGDPAGERTLRAMAELVAEFRRDGEP